MKLYKIVLLVSILLMTIGVLVALLSMLTPVSAFGMSDEQTLTDLKHFLSVDQTDRHVYDESMYSCYQFSQDLKRNATMNGYKCYMVQLQDGGRGHEIVMFSLSDGYYFVEPQDDTIVDVFSEYPDTILFTVFNSNEYIRGG